MLGKQRRRQKGINCIRKYQLERRTETVAPDNGRAAVEAATSVERAGRRFFFKCVAKAKVGFYSVYTCDASSKFKLASVGVEVATNNYRA